MCFNLCRNQDGYEFNAFSDEEVEEENDYYGGVKAVEERIHGGGGVFVGNPYEPFDEQAFDIDDSNTNSEESSYTTPAAETSSDDEKEVIDAAAAADDDDDAEEILARDTDSSYDSETNETDPTSRFVSNVRQTSFRPNNDTHQG